MPTMKQYMSKDEAGYEFVLQAAFDNRRGQNGRPTRQEREEFLSMVKTLFHGYFPSNSGVRLIGSVTRKVAE